MSRPFRYVGQPLPRVEDAGLLAGRARYLDDVTLPGMLHAAFVRSPHAHARLGRVDAARARALDGVSAVLAPADVGETGRIVTGSTRPEAKVGERPLLPLDRVRHVGEPVAVVAASSRYVAEDACELVDVEYEPLAAVVDPEHALAPGAPVLHEAHGDNSFARIRFASDDVDDAFASAAHVFGTRLHLGRTHAAPLEGRGIVASFEPGPGELTVWSSTQMPHLVKWLLASLLGLRESRVRVLVPAVGGGFGLKVHLFVEEVLVCLLAMRLARPVKWTDDRYEHLAASGHSKEVVTELELATDAEGRFTALRGRFVGDGGAHQGHPWTSLIDPLCAAQMITGIYDVQTVAYEVDAVATNKAHSVAYRGVGWTPGHAARELLVDEAARGLGVDPVELRLRNAVPDREPYATATGAVLDGGSYAESMRRACEAIGYEGLRARQKALRREGRYLGIGISPFVEQGGWAAEIADAMGFPGLSYHDAVRVTVEPDGTVVLATGFQSNGQGHETTLAQVAADALGVRVEDVRVVQGDTDATAYSTGSWGSRTALIGGGAVLRAAGDVREKLLRIAACELEAAEHDLEIEDGRVFVKGSPDRGTTVAALAASAYWTRPAAGEEPALTATRSYDPPQVYSNACVACVVEVDAETGRVDVQRLLIVEDCGRMVNPLIVDGQASGALAQAVGAVLYEGVEYATDGSFLNGSLMDFLYPTATELPSVEVEHLTTLSPSEGGFKGMGEGGLIGAPAALINAVADALAPFGARIERTPLRPCDVLALIDAGR